MTEIIQAEVKHLAPEIDFTVHAEPPKKIEDLIVDIKKEKAKKEAQNKCG